MLRTLEKLTLAFILESQARNRYTFYAKVAKKEGYPQISDIFLATADQEREHAKWLFRHINELKDKVDENIEEIQEAETPNILGDLVKEMKDKATSKFKEKVDETLENILIVAQAPTTLGDTAENLQAAIDGEHYENTEMYPEFADVADKEGFPDIADRLRSIAKSEGHHERRYIKLLDIVESGTVFEKDQEVEWACRKCGYLHKGTTPPEECPSCDHGTKHFEILCEEY